MPLQLWSHYFGSYYNGDKLSKTYFISTIKMSGSKHLLRMRGFVGAVIVIPKKLTGLQTLFKQYSNIILFWTNTVNFLLPRINKITWIMFAILCRGFIISDTIRVSLCNCIKRYWCLNTCFEKFKKLKVLFC